MFFDECRERDGTMIDAKGAGYANLLKSPYLTDVIAKRWAKQALRQLQASSGRDLEWYFAEEGAAAKAHEIFDDNGDLRGRISVYTVPAVWP